MKKIKHNIQRVGDNQTVVAAWRTRMRTPATVKIDSGKAPDGVAYHEDTLIHGDAAEVFDTLSGIAEIAWEMGWRPRGLDAVVSGVVKSYKIPTE